MKLLVIGDLHSNLKPLKNLIAKHPDADAILSVGDLGFYFSEVAMKEDKKQYMRSPNLMRSFLAAHESGLMEPLKMPLYYIKGNHDDYDNLYSPEMKALNVHFFPQASILKLGDLIIAGIGGIYSDVRTKWTANQFTGRERRFFTTEELKDFKTMHDGTKVDILLTHQAAAGCLPNKNEGWDEGSVHLQALLDHVQPALYFHGHHHKNYQVQRDVHTTVVGLGHFGKNNKSCRIIEVKEGKRCMYGA